MLHHRFDRVDLGRRPIRIPRVHLQDPRKGRGASRCGGEGKRTVLDELRHGEVDCPLCLATLDGRTIGRTR